jgi:hypothetical protein
MSNKIILPNSAGCKESYISILKTAYYDNRDIYFFHDYIKIVQVECGVSPETAEGRCKQLSSLRLLIYVNSGLAGHNYKLCLFYKNENNEIIYIDSWLEASRFIETQFKDIIQNEFVQIRKMNIGATLSPVRFEDEREKAEQLMNSLSAGSVIKSDSEDVIKSEFKTIKNSSAFDSSVFGEN